jgi:hypothetical protein
LTRETIAALNAATAIPTAFTHTVPSLETTSLPVILNDSDVSLAAPSKDRVVGRIFAWLCTTLYLTSRLPQIWKNVSISHSTIDTLDLMQYAKVRQEIC